MYFQVKRIYGGFMVEAQHGIFSDGLRGMNEQELEEFIRWWDRCGKDMRQALETKRAAGAQEGLK